jgi:hypothetical protein
MLPTLRQCLSEYLRTEFATPPTEGIPRHLVGTGGGLGILYRDLLRQASMLSFNDAFYLVSVLMTCILPLVFLMKREKGATTTAGMH